MTATLTRRGMVAGLGAAAGWVGGPDQLWNTPSPSMETALSEFRVAAAHFVQVRFETFYAGAMVRRTFPTFECQDLQSWDRAIGRLRRAAQAVFTQASNSASEVRCKFAVAEALFGNQPLPDTEWSYSHAQAWLTRLEAEADRFGLTPDVEWMQKTSAFFDRPDEDFYAVLGRIAGRTS